VCNGGVTTELTAYFRSLVAALDAHAGWYGAFTARQPGVARAYEAGAELPPWDVVHTVLHDAAAARGTAPGPRELARAYALHQAAVAAWDAAPGAEPALRARLDAAVRAHEAAALREREAARALAAATATAPASPAAERLAAVHAWTRDDHRRAASRRVELQTRLLSFTTVPAAGPRPAGAAQTAPGAASPGGQGRAEHGAAGTAPGAASSGGQGRAEGRRPRGARFAGAYQEDEPSSAAATAPAREAPAGRRPPSAPPSAPRPLRGARFAGAPQPAVAENGSGPAEDPRWAAEARAAVARLAGARAAGESGAAYVVLCEAAAGPAERLPYVVRELGRAGLTADVATLLWEVAVLPAVRLADAARALSGHGRAAECRELLHQAASRPAADIAVLAAALLGPDRAELLTTLSRTRPAEVTAAVARAHPGLIADLLAAAERVSAPRRRDVAAALRRAGLPDR
jgi:hypothetical protein